MPWTDQYPFIQALMQRRDDRILYEDGVGRGTPIEQPSQGEEEPEEGLEEGHAGQ